MGKSLCKREDILKLRLTTNRDCHELAMIQYGFRDDAWTFTNGENFSGNIRDSELDYCQLVAIPFCGHAQLEISSLFFLC